MDRQRRKQSDRYETNFTTQVIQCEERFTVANYTLSFIMAEITASDLRAAILRATF